MSCGYPVEFEVDAKLPLTDKLDSEASEFLNRGAADRLLLASPSGATRAIRIFELEANNNGHAVEATMFSLVVCILYSAACGVNVYAGHSPPPICTPLSVGSMQLLAKTNHAWDIKGSKGLAFKPQDPDAKTCPVQYSLHGTLL
ncbi:hypothetical protein O1611_g9250 [Lasiodiplodia mahajangana]|uniref:Uncharacterized protein n=1 Tax=Lasiodiplodia mahajangana TaxID=1108764 RepID=A0ACC2JAH4_9PEZI|nr:hypothetical protein O1611_g9250 [Lasiodiplodia mahajangana]